MYNPTMMKMQGFPSNFKTVKCKYFENGGFCKNGTLLYFQIGKLIGYLIGTGCTFSHGEENLGG